MQLIVEVVFANKLRVNNTVGTSDQCTVGLTDHANCNTKYPIYRQLTSV